MKKTIKSTGKRLLLACLFLTIFSTAQSQDKLMGILRTEIQREKKAYDVCPQPPYYIALRVEDNKRQVISTTFGSLIASAENHTRRLSPVFRVGSYALDNFHPGGLKNQYMPVSSVLPFDDNDKAIQQTVWMAMDNCYKAATNSLMYVKSNMAVAVPAEDKSPDFSNTPVVKYYEPLLTEAQTRLDRTKWEGRLRKYSQMFLKDTHIINGSANMTYDITRKHYIDTEGTEAIENITAARVMISGSVRADDGMELPLYLSYFSFTPEGLPDDKTIGIDVQALVEKLIHLRTAPVVEPYTGPVLLLGTASGVFFHEIFGHRVEGLRMRKASDGQTFKKKIGENVLPSTFSVLMDPSMKNFKGQDLNGYYPIDDQGVRGERVNVVENGVLKNFLMTRTPLDGFPRSNGHARSSAGMDVVSRQSNLIVTTSDPKTDEQLRTLLKEEAKNQGKAYGYIFASVSGGFTMTMTSQPNAFNVTPVEVYRVFVDGRPDELVRGVDLVGTPLAMFSQIMCAGGKSEVFTGVCGAESGSVPVSAVSPSVLVKQVEMQRKDKSLDRLPILERPAISLTNNN